MMQQIRRIFLILIVGFPVVGFLAASVPGCSGSQQASGIYRSDLGRAPSPGILSDVIATTLQSYGYQLHRAGDDLVETEWKTRASREGGAEQSRDRAQVYITQRGRDMYVAKLRAEFEVMQEGRWVRAEPSQAAYSEYRELEREIERRLQQYMTQN